MRSMITVIYICLRRGGMRTMLELACGDGGGRGEGCYKGDKDEGENITQVLR